MCEASQQTHWKVRSKPANEQEGVSDLVLVGIQGGDPRSVRSRLIVKPKARRTLSSEMLGEEASSSVRTSAGSCHAGSARYSSLRDGVEVLLLLLKFKRNYL